jgi:SAM-dependent methyltransferase
MDKSSPASLNAIWPPDALVPRDTCPGCGSTRASGPLAFRGDGLPIKECADCGLIYVDPVPTRSALYARYDDGYFTGQSDFFRGADYRELRDRSIGEGNVTGFREIAAHFDLAGLSILEIGCATGALLQSLSRFHPARMVGIDLASSAVEFGRSRYGLDLRATTLEDAAFAPAQFDLIVMVDLIEHVFDLDGFMNRVLHCLKPGGAIYITTPDAGGFRAAGDRWCHLYLNYEHVHYFSVESLTSLARRRGLEVDESWSEGYPVAMRQYRRPDATRFSRLLMEPHVAAGNWHTRWKYRNAAAQNRGAALHAILRRSAGTAREIRMEGRAKIAASR